MTLEELVIERKKAYQLYKNTYIMLSVDYLNSNPRFEIGDILKSRLHVGKVLKIKPSVNLSDTTSKPKLMYFCEILKSDGKPRKKPYQAYLYDDDGIELFKEAK